MNIKLRKDLQADVTELSARVLQNPNQFVNECVALVIKAAKSPDEVVSSHQLIRLLQVAKLRS